MTQRFLPQFSFSVQDSTKMHNFVLNQEVGLLRKKSIFASLMAFFLFFSTQLEIIWFETRVNVIMVINFCLASKYFPHSMQGYADETLDRKFWRIL